MSEAKLTVAVVMDDGREYEVSIPLRDNDLVTAFQVKIDGEWIIQTPLHHDAERIHSICRHDENGQVEVVRW